MYYSVIGSTWVFGLYQCLWSLYRFAAPWNRRLHAFKLKTSVCVSFFAKLHQTKQLSNACRFSPFPKCIFIFSPAPGMKGVSCGSFVFWGEGGGERERCLACFFCQLRPQWITCPLLTTLYELLFGHNSSFWRGMFLEFKKMRIPFPRFFAGSVAMVIISLLNALSRVSSRDWKNATSIVIR